MKFELVELYLSGSGSAAASEATGARARLATRGYAFTMAGGAGR